MGKGCLWAWFGLGCGPLNYVYAAAALKDIHCDDSVKVYKPKVISWQMSVCVAELEDCVKRIVLKISFE